MTHRDIIDFKQESVKFIEDENAIKFFQNTLYRPILVILRSGIKTAEEITEEIGAKREYKDSSTKPPSLKTIYRHIKALTEVDLVIQAGVRILDRSDEEKPSTTKKLFSRTAKFFYFKTAEKEAQDSEKIKKRAEILSKIFAMKEGEKEPAIECFTRLLKNIRSCDASCSEELYRDFPDEMAEIAGDLPFNELQGIMRDYSILSLLMRYPEFKKDLKECIGLE